MTPAQRDAAAAEADEIWAVIRPDVEKAGFRLAEIGGQTDVAKGLPFGNSGYSAYGSASPTNVMRTASGGGITAELLT
jgi:hypothetical protein